MTSPPSSRGLAALLVSFGLALWPHPCRPEAPGASVAVWSYEGLQVTLNADLMRGWYGPHSSSAGMVTVGIEGL